MASGPRSWRLVLGAGDGLVPAAGAWNMALDAAILESVRAGARPVLRLYRWSPACLSFGRNQPARGRYDRDQAARQRIDFVRRPTGGQAVLHDQELTYAVVAPVPLLGRPREAYRRINGALVAAVRSLGIPAAVAAPAIRREAPAAAPPGAVAPGRGREGGAVNWSAACFRRPAPGEVVVEGRKLVGSAQRAEGRVILQHGSLLVSGSQSAAEDLLVARPAGVGEADSGWTTVAAELGGCPEWTALVGAVVAGFEATLGTTLAPSGLAVAEARRAAALRPGYESETWTWRR
jgi:lipoyl(octanoyl) transferase